MGKILSAPACSPVPEGRTVWTAGMLANRLVELRIVESVSENTVLRVTSRERLAAEVAAWVAERNRIEAKIVWTFRVADARKKLDFLYPEELVR